MDRVRSSVLGLGLLAIVVMPAFAHADMEGSQARATVRLFNAAAVDQETLTRALDRAVGLLKQAGVQIAWLDCTFQENSRYQELCQRPVRATDLIMAIVPQFESWRPNVSRTTLGYAVTPPGRALGHNAYISYGRAAQLAWENQLPLDLILGFAMAHEISHLLLASNDHSPFGLMRAMWDSADWQRAGRGELAFTPAEATRLRVGILVRAVAERSRAWASQPREETSAGRRR